MNKNDFSFFHSPFFWFAGRMCMRTGGASEIETEVEGTGSLLFKESYDEAVHKNPYEI